MCSECLIGLLSILRGPVDHDEQRKDFESTVAFLTKVPLLRNHLPRAELPKMAASLTRRAWKPGTTLVSQGDTGKALYLIQSGVALVYVREAGSQSPELRCELRAGDYFGGHTLTTSRPNVATVIAGDCEEEGELVTLSMSRAAFEESGLKNWLHFPKRPALYQAREDSDTTKLTKKTPEEEALLRNAILESANLRAFVKLEDEQLHGLVQAAERRMIPANSIIGRRGEATDEFCIIYSGTVDVILTEEIQSSNSGYIQAECSLEAKMEKKCMAERMLRKQVFLQSLCSSMTTPKKGTQSQVMLPGAGQMLSSVDAKGSGAGSFHALSGSMLTSGPTGSSSANLGQRRASGPGPRQGMGRHATFSAVSPGLNRAFSNVGAAAEPEARLITTQSSRAAPISRSLTNTDNALLSQSTWRFAVSTPDEVPPGSAPSKRKMQPRQGKAPSSSGTPPGSWAGRLAPGRSDSICSQELPSRELSGGSSFLRMQSTPSGAPACVPVLGELEGEASLGPGDSFGELAVLYHMGREATFRAIEDCVVFAVRRADFWRWCHRDGRKVKDYVKVLDEVHALQQLLSSERYELACHVHSMRVFEPGEKVLQQGRDRDFDQWYVVAKGSAEQYMMKTGTEGKQENIHLSSLHRGSHFGERALLRNDRMSQSTVETGKQGMTCLVFEYADIQAILKKVFMTHGSDLPSPDCPILEWCQRLAAGWNDQNKGSIGVTKRGQTVKFENLVKKCNLGRGGFCQVSLVEDTTTHKKYALKTMSKGYLAQCGAERQIQWERELLSVVDSPFIITLQKTFTDSQHIYFLLEAALGGSLNDVLTKNPEVFQEDNPRGLSAAFYAGCLALALEHLHQRMIVHRDVKTENALLDERGYAKLCDMGFARYVLGKTSTLAGTPDYMAPEMIDFPHTHDTSVDWWALGVLTFELLSGQTPFEDEGILEPRGRLLAIRRSQESGKLVFPFSFPHASKAFVSALLRKLPHRLGAGEGGAQKVKEHPMFRAVKLDWQHFEARQLPAPFSKAWDESAELEVNEGDFSELNVDLYGCMDDRTMNSTDHGLGLSINDSLYVHNFDEKAGASWERMIS